MTPAVLLGFEACIAILEIIQRMNASQRATQTEELAQAMLRIRAFLDIVDVDVRDRRTKDH